jgi:hypothetical protein
VFLVLAVILVLVFALGVAIGAFAIIAMSVRREDRTGVGSRGARVVTGVLTRQSAGQAAPDAEFAGSGNTQGAGRIRRIEWVSGGDGRPPAPPDDHPGEERHPQPAETMEISIYLSMGECHEAVEAAVVDLLTRTGLSIESSDDPVIGSWFRRMRAAVDKAAHSEAAREGALIATHIADARLVLAQDAAITATLMQNLGPVITALQPTKDAVVRLGALLIVKVDWTVTIHQLTAAQQAQLDHQPHLATAPHEVFAALCIQSPNGDGREKEMPPVEAQRSQATPPHE